MGMSPSRASCTSPPCSQRSPASSYPPLVASRGRCGGSGPWWPCVWSTVLSPPLRVLPLFSLEKLSRPGAHTCPLLPMRPVPVVEIPGAAHDPSLLPAHALLIARVMPDVTPTGPGEAHLRIERVFL